MKQRLIKALIITVFALLTLGSIAAIGQTTEDKYSVSWADQDHNTPFYSYMQGESYEFLVEMYLINGYVDIFLTVDSLPVYWLRLDTVGNIEYMDVENDR